MVPAPRRDARPGSHDRVAARSLRARVIPDKAAKTQTEHRRHVAKLRAVFGAMPLLPFQPKLVYQYVDRREAKSAAHNEVRVLSHAYTKAVEWGYIDRHPFKGEVQLKGEKPRDRYVEIGDSLKPFPCYQCGKPAAFDLCRLRPTQAPHRSTPG